MIQLISFVVMIIMARILSPREYGLVAMVKTLTGFASLFAELGLGVALIQAKTVNELQLSSVFWLNTVFGGVLSVVFLVGAPFIALFYGEPHLQGITAVLAVVFILNALMIVHRCLLTRDLKFRTLSTATIVATVVSGLVGVAMAVLGFHYWALVGQALTMPVVSAAVLSFKCKWTPQLRFSYTSIRELMSFGVNVLGTSTLDYWARNVDKVLLGKFVGTEALGLYSRAYAFLIARVSGFNRTISQVFFPVLSRVQDDKKRVKAAYLKTIGVISLISFPTTLGLIATADQLVTLLLGPQWDGAVPILRALGVLGITASAGSLNGALFLSQGAARLQFRLGLILKGVMITGVIVGLRWGAVGVALGFGVATLLCSYPAISLAGRLVGMKYREYLWVISGPLVWALVMLISVIFLGKLLPSNLHPTVILACKITTGVTVYWGGVHLFKIPAYRDLSTVVSNRLRCSPT